jgi:hypothetical protein
MKKRTGRSNLERVFEVEDIPSDTQMREILDGAPIEPLRRVLPETFERMRRVGWTERFVIELDGKKYDTVALDGSEYFHSTQIHCPGCLHHQSSNGETHYSHLVVAATLVRAGSHDILPLDAEEVRNEDGQKKQDCEINAGKRLVERLRLEHPQLKTSLTGDDLYAHKTRHAGLSNRQTTRKTVLKRAVTVRGRSGACSAATGAPEATACWTTCCCSLTQSSEASSKT